MSRGWRSEANSGIAHMVLLVAASCLTLTSLVRVSDRYLSYMLFFFLVCFIEALFYYSNTFLTFFPFVNTSGR